MSRLRFCGMMSCASVITTHPSIVEKMVNQSWFHPGGFCAVGKLRYAAVGVSRVCLSCRFFFYCSLFRDGVGRSVVNMRADLTCDGSRPVGQFAVPLKWPRGLVHNGSTWIQIVRNVSGLRTYVQPVAKSCSNGDKVTVVDSTSILPRHAHITKGHGWDRKSRARHAQTRHEKGPREGQQQ